MGSLKIIRYALWALVVTVAGAVGYISFTTVREANSVQQLSEAVQIGGPFELTAMTGEPFDTSSMDGAPYAIFFGFTYCPDVCPTTLFEMSTWLETLGDDADNVQALFVTVDPERDTPEVLSDYVSAFGDRIMGLTGTPAEIGTVARAHRVFYQRTELDDGDYTMDHTASVFLFRGDGSFFGTIAYGEAADSAQEKLKRLAKT